MSGGAVMAAAGGTFHVVAPAPPSQAETLAMIAGGLGARGGLMLVDARTAPLREPSPLERRVARRLAPYGDDLEQDVSLERAS
jgi:hypothetical protein